MRFTPNNISHLENDEIFVFGSNEAGIHGAGAAKLAFDRFGAVWGIGVGHQGKTYAIPTKDSKIRTLDLVSIADYVADFLDFADEHPEFKFLVTQIGCGLAGYQVEDIAPLFEGYPLNVVLPKEFVDFLRSYC
ncbi:MAG: hypothetical protein EBU90_00930 [Proteobacteria bacterium]|nr:hypothetical protein [Pseudomonadota bacterium]NBP12997.1 hypothetical protein [bacterium]